MISKASQEEMISGKGTKDDAGKVRMSLIPGRALLEIGKVFTYGALKYKEDNYLNGMPWRRMCDAAERHIQQWKSGEDYDNEEGGSGLHHLAHAGCCIIMLLMYCLLKQFKIHDDRWKPEPEDLYTKEKYRR